jgi:hypothetical protein
LHSSQHQVLFHTYMQKTKKYFEVIIGFYWKFEAEFARNYSTYQDASAIFAVVLSGSNSSFSHLSYTFIASLYFSSLCVAAGLGSWRKDGERTKLDVSKRNPLF